MTQHEPSAKFESYLYVFIRQDIPIEHQLVQSGHAIYKIVHLYHPSDSCPNHVCIGVPDTAALNRVLDKLRKHQIPHAPWIEPDNDLGFTAIATAPISGQQRAALREYQVWKHSPVTQSAEYRPLTPGVLVRSQPGEPGPSSSGQEHRSNRSEVAG